MRHIKQKTVNYNYNIYYIQKKIRITIHWKASDLCVCRVLKD